MYGKALVTWKGDYFTGDPGRYVEKALQTSISFHREPRWETWLMYQGHRDG
jgi:hypothetical protein